MSEVALRRFACDGCGKSYQWKPALSKKRVKCPCGTAMTVPDLSEPAPPIEDVLDGPPALPGDDVYDMIDSAPAKAAPAAVLAADAAHATPVARTGVPIARPARGQPLNYRGGPTKRDQAAGRSGIETFYDVKRDIYLPAGLVGGSFLVYIAWLFIHGRGNSVDAITTYAVTMGAVFLVKTVFMIAAAFVVAPMAGVSFGPIWTAILKLGALCLVPDIFATVLDQAVGVPGMWIISSSLALALYWILMSVLFQLDASDAWMVVVYFSVIRFLLGIIIGMFIFTAVLSGGIGGSMSGGSGSSSAGPAPSAKAAAFDEKVDEMKDMNGLEETSVLFDKGKATGMRQHVDGLMDAGAKHIWFTVSRDINGHLEPGDLIVEWPRAAAKRKSLLAALEAYRQAHMPLSMGGPAFAFTDDGGQYLEVPTAAR